MALIDVPLASQTLGITQPDIRANFATINAAFLVDHVEYNIANQGFHNKITFPLLGAAPAFGGLNGLWSQVYTTTTIGEIWVNSRNGNQYPMTASVLSLTPAIGNNTDGWTYLPSGIVIKWGFVTFSLGNVFISFAGIGPAFGATFNATIGLAAPAASNTVVSITALGVLGFSLNANTAASTSVYWSVIGRE